MPSQGWRQVLVSSSADGALTNTVTETRLIPVAGLFVLPGNFLSVPGQMLRLRAAGRISNAASATMTFRVKFHTTPIIVAASQAIALNATSKTNVTFFLEWWLTARAVGNGTSANFMHTAAFTSEAVIGVGTGTFASTQSIPASAPAVGTGFDSTAANLVDFTGQWGAASASNSIQLHQYELGSEN